MQTFLPLAQVQPLQSALLPLQLQQGILRHYFIFSPYNESEDSDFTSCGTRWLDSEDSCRRSLQIALQRAKCRCTEMQVKLEETPSGARLKRKAASFYELCSQEEESARVELLKYEEEGVICDLRHVRARSGLVEEIDSLTRSIGWMVVDLKPDQKWEVAHDRVMAQDLLSRSER